jgi:signal transduction histidine kinase
MKNSQQPPFKNERLQTDDSLVKERGKADDSFETYNENAEDKTDLVLKSGRSQADEARLERRNHTDGQRNKIIKNGDNLILAERKLEDKEIEIERSNMDLALRHERGEKERLMTKLLSQERDETDRNLLGEREKTDLEVKRTGEVLKDERAAHLETKSALMTHEEFVAIVSHDLRNPIGAILSSVDILLEDDSMSDEGVKWIELIKRNAASSLRLISDILDMERIVDGKMQLQLTKVSLDELVNETIESNLQVAKAKGVALSVERSSLANLVACDRDRVGQVLSNLIGNALKFTPSGGRISVAVAENHNEVEVSITDTGPGIPEDQKSRIFERFAQLGNKDRRGIGLGLYISKSIVESHNGKLWVTSIFGEGSTFSFTLPVLDF